MANTRRVNLNMGMEIYEYFYNLSVELGIPFSSLIVTTLDQSRLQRESAKMSTIYYKLQAEQDAKDNQ